MNVLVGGACLAALEEVVVAGDGYAEGLGAELVDAGEVGAAEHLEIVLAVESQQGAGYLGEVVGGVEGEEGAHPACIHLLFKGVGRSFLEADAVDLLRGEAFGVAEDDGLVVL